MAFHLKSWQVEAQTLFSKNKTKMRSRKLKELLSRIKTDAGNKGPSCVRGEKKARGLYMRPCVCRIYTGGGEQLGLWSSY